MRKKAPYIIAFGFAAYALALYHWWGWYTEEFSKRIAAQVNEETKRGAGKK